MKEEDSLHNSLRQCLGYARRDLAAANDRANHYADLIMKAESERKRCPWCRGKQKHSETCPAFLPDGDIR